MDPLSERLSRLSPERLAQLMHRVRGAETAPAASIPRRAGTGPCALSFAQQRLWFIQQLDPRAVGYNTAGLTRLEGVLDVAAMRRALDGVVERHEAMRTVFALHDGAPVQVVVPGMRVPLAVEDLSGLDPAEWEAETARRARREQARPFSLETGPLIRATLLRLSPTRHALVLVMHHVISDGWSRGVIVRDISALYTAIVNGEEPRLPPLPVQYADYALWQRERLAGDFLAEQLGYWRGQLAGAPPALALPTDHPRPAVRSSAGRTHRFRLSRGVEDALRALARAEGATLFMVLLAAFKTLLARYTGHGDVLVGTPVSNRGRSETEGLVGFFANMLALRTDLSGDPTFREAVRRVRDTALGAYAHEELPFERVVEELQPERSLSRNEVFQVVFQLDEAPPQPFRLPGLELVPVELDAGTSIFDLTLKVEKNGDGLAAGLEYSTALWDAATVERMAEHFRVLLGAVALDADARVWALPLMPAAERALLALWNATDRGYPSGLLVHELFAAQASRTPDSPALAFRGEAISYGDLDRRANRLANHLRLLGVGPETRVGVCLERTPELIVSLLAVVKAGGAYVPLDPAYPRERLGYMTEDASVLFVLTTEQLAERLPAGAEPVCIDAIRSSVESESADAPAIHLLPDNLSHVIFTSGSTGRPKGVMIRHSSTAILLHWLRENVTDEERASVLGSTSINFDVSIAEIFGTLCWGGKLVLVENALELPAVADQEIRYASMVPTAAAELLRSGGIPATVRTLNLGGEALPNDLAQSLYALGTVEKVGNLYGPTEDTTYSTYSVVRRGGDRVLVGRPVANTRAYVLDERLRPVPVGIIGELYLAGDGLSRGYAGRPDMTAERFIPNPFDGPGARMYRVMDRIRWTADGELEYFGRTDFQVKVRGFRIELGEIETALRAHDAVRDAVAVVREDAPGDRRIVAYVVSPEGSEAPTVADLRAHLKERVPEYMVPSAFVSLEALPLTPNGKVDRNALPAPDASTVDADEYVAPRTADEEHLAALFAEVLGVGRVGVHDDFFALGGHSLLATRVATRVREAMGAELTVRTLFEEPTVAGLAPRIHALRAESTPAGGPPLVPIPRDRPLPLSFAQQRLWLVDRLHGASEVYNLSAALRLRGELDVEALRAALEAVVARHEALRTRYDEVRGAPVQVVEPPMRFSLAVTDLSGVAGEEREAYVHRHAEAEAARPFDLARAPLVRAALLRLGDREHVLLAAMHHIAADGWSVALFMDELKAHYAALLAGAPAALPPLALQYGDYAVWQRAREGDAAVRGDLEFWTRTLAGAPAATELPADRPRPAVQGFRGSTLEMRIDPALAGALRALARAEDATLYMVLLAGFGAWLRRCTGQDDLVVGSPVAGRGHPALEPLIGCFINLVPLRLRPDGRESFRQALAAVRGTALDAFAHQDVSFDQVVDALGTPRDASRPALVQVLLALQNTPPGRFALAGVEAEPVETPGHTSRYDLGVYLREEDGGALAALVEWDTDLFDRATVRRWMGHFTRLLASLAADPGQPHGRAELMDEAERGRVLHAWNATDTARDRAATLPALLAAQARRTPGAPALTADGQTLAYAALDRRANRLAHRLRALGVGPERRVGLLMERSAAMIVSMLAVLKAGGAYVPLDPAYPDARVRFMARDAGLALVLADAALRERLADCVPQTLVPGDEAEDATPDDDPAVGVDPLGAAYVIYTSGSTGRPKGVVVPHRGVANFFAAMDARVGAAPATWLALTSICFDISVLEILWTLSRGSHVVLHGGPARATSADGEMTVAARILAHGVTHVQCTPSMAGMLAADPDARAALAGVRCLLVGGEALPAGVAAGLREAGVPRLLNLYGPTETTVWSAVHEVDGTPGPVPIGRPVGNTRIYLVDADWSPVPAGVAGELWIGGEGVVRGYHGRPGLTAERFVPDAFGPVPGARLYRTGDLARRRGDGALEFMGRTDQQVKVRGHRIEPGEVEAVLAAHPAVRECVVVARADGAGEPRLAAYLTPAGGAGGVPPAPELRRWAGERLPGALVPSRFVPLERMPLTPNGKVDRRALPDPAPSRAALEVEYAPPRNDLEGSITEVWCEVLGVERVGIRDNFFDLGGTSLRLAAAHRLLAQRLEQAVTVVDLLRYPTVAGLAEFLGSDGEDGGGVARRRDEVNDRAERQRQAQQARRQRQRGRG